MLSLLPEGLSLAAFWITMAASFAGSFITAAFGIGGGGLLLAILASIVPPAALIPVHGVVQAGSNAGRMVMLWREIFWPALPWFAVGTLIGVAIGGAVAVELPPQYVQIGVGAFVIYTVLARAPRWFSRWPLFTGLISSFLTMFFGATGLFVASFTKSHKLPRHAHVATHATLMTLQHGLKVVAFGVLGFAYADWIWVIALMIGVGLVGTYAGRLVLNRLTDVRFGLTLNILLVLISLRLIWQGITTP
ncbi:sulfite exporter TauE/SafE family protein [Rhodobacteraceae bacterium N5(2021)]|uniref:Probable membrane transporter protein n=1 Tax=Gymnodinialimonas phycosphaerae TaxID=2841589 RepID=A0A975TWM5_9RHOB|nr:sulfite exporter TauE/SafE family protein [Gymnodinialimonas phycosphaerae]MBY4892190.1 sulfite exporter TauE/SafE family protein [Gymnodinialimonas phycosphaerae]